MSKYAFTIKYLSDTFYDAYPAAEYPEILKKDSRPYTCLLLKTHYDFFICIPFRTDIRHKYAYHFHSSRRASAHHSGLDYTKMVLISDASFIDSAPAVVDQDEYVELRSNIEKICKKALIYLEDYIAFINGKHVIDSEEFFRRYRYSALPCFHDILFHSSQTPEFLL